MGWNAEDVLIVEGVYDNAGFERGICVSESTTDNATKSHFVNPSAHASRLAEQGTYELVHQRCRS